MYVVNESPNWRITSKQKSQDTVMRKLQFSDTLCQSIHFHNDQDKIDINKQAVEDLLISFNTKPSHGFKFNNNDLNTPSNKLLWENVDSKKIIKFFSDYKTTSLARQNNSKSIREYISLCNQNKKQLINWSVLLSQGSHESIEFNNPSINKYSPKCIFRSFDEKNSKDYEKVWSVGVLSDPIDEICDLNNSEWEMTKETHAKINNARAQRNQKISNQIYSGKAARYTRGLGTDEYRG